MRLIDADVLLNGLDSICVEKMNSKKPCPLVCTLCPLSDMLDVIENAPTVDAVQVVRCRDCKYWDDEDHACGLRDCYGWDYKPYSFCSWAERRDENADDPD